MTQPTTPATTTPAAPVSDEIAAADAHTDPLLVSLVKDVSLSIKMGVAAFDISTTQHHFVVSMYPPVFPSAPSAHEDDIHDGSDESKLCEGRLLLFPLPHSSSDASQLGFYLDYGWNTLETVRDAIGSRLNESREMARDRLNEAKDKWATTAGKANEKIQQAKTKIMSAFTGLFGKK